MDHIRIESFADLDNAIEGISKSALCRGVSDIAHELKPSLFRHKIVANFEAHERNMMWLFKTSAKAILRNTPENELEWLVVAQHHGLPTRLLDWSLSPLVACFFAVHSLSETDGAIYIFDRKKFEREENVNLEELDRIVAFFPSHVSPRIAAQSGMFTIHPTNEILLEDDHDRLFKLVIPAEQKRKFMDRLAKYGIHHGTIFPDLDGLSNYIKYLNNY